MFKYVLYYIIYFVSYIYCIFCILNIFFFVYFIYFVYCIYYIYMIQKQISWAQIGPCTSRGVVIGKHRTMHREIYDIRTFGKGGTVRETKFKVLMVEARVYKIYIIYKKYKYTKYTNTYKIHNKV